jgi:hypothetical protein
MFEAINSVPIKWLEFIIFSLAVNAFLALLLAIVQIWIATVPMRVWTPWRKWFFISWVLAHLGIFFIVTYREQTSSAPAITIRPSSGRS